MLRVAKLVKDKQTVHTLWGNKVHKALELRVRDKTKLPDEMNKWEPLAAMFDTRPNVFVETRFALTRNLTPTQWNAPDTWCRGIVDVGFRTDKRAFLGDWKTGKIKHDSSQLKMSAGAYMKSNPFIEQTTTGFVWLPDNKLTKETFTRDDLPEIWDGFITRSSRLESAYKSDKWLPKPSGLCNGWCPVGKEYCEFWCPGK